MKIPSRNVVSVLKTVADIGLLGGLLAGLLGGSVSCIKRYPASLPPLDLSLQSGVEEVARLNDSEAQVRARSQFTPTRSEISASSELGILRFTHCLHFESLGFKAYFRSGRVALIEIQDPFRGNLIGKNTKIFPFARSNDKSWEESLVRDFGEPNARSSGGRLSSDLLLYNWGDISYNGLGPNQIALYRDDDIAEYRKRNFGRIIRFWN